MEAQVAWISMALLLGLVGVLYLLLPRISRRGLLFGVYVGEATSKGEDARRITRSWYWGVTAWLSVSLILTVVSGLYFKSRVGSSAAMSLLAVGFMAENLRAYFRARRLAKPGEPPAVAALVVVEESQGAALPYWAVVLGLVAGLLLIGDAWFHYTQLPKIVPTHFGFTGKPDGWRPKSFSTVMLLPIMTLILGVGLGGMSYLISQAKRAIRYGDRGVSFEAQQRFRRAMANFLAVVSILVTGLLSLIAYTSIRVGLGKAPALPPTMMILALVLVIFSLGGSIFIAIKFGQGGSQLERSAADAPLTDGLADNRLWVLGMFYVNREDPSLFVEHRFGLGYTLNFGNPKAVGLIVGFVGLMGLIAILAALAK
ncbi:MAG: DUF5808 domain-containing protein [Terriglobia bacterium]